MLKKSRTEKGRIQQKRTNNFYESVGNDKKFVKKEVKVMKIQSLSIVVPNNRCVNNCAFCVSKMHTNDYPNMLSIANPNLKYWEDEYIERLEFTRDNGCNTVILTGNSEPQQNKVFLRNFSLYNQIIKNPYKWIELQTTGVNLTSDYLLFLKNTVKVSVLSISLSSFLEIENYRIIGSKSVIPVREICKTAYNMGFIIRICINLNSCFSEYRPEEMFMICKKVFFADQVTFRKLYAVDGNEQSKWIEEHKFSDEKFDEILKYISSKGECIGQLPFNNVKMLVNGVSTVVDADCMQKHLETADSYKYLILRPDCHLYTSWDSKGSILF